MFQFPAVLAIVLSVGFAAVEAVPFQDAAARAVEVASRQSGPESTIPIFSGPNFTGSSTIVGINYGQCTSLPSAFQAHIDSIDIDNDINCTFYVNLNCQGQSLQVTIPGVNDLGAVDGGVFKNNLKSVVCVGV